MVYIYAGKASLYLYCAKLQIALRPKGRIMDDKYLPRNIEKTWTDVAEKQLEGRKIVNVRYVGTEEMEDLD